VINEISLKSFKCFENSRIPLAELTLLSGANASGKSSILQSLTLLHQTMREHEWSTRLMLNGGSLRLGTFRDVVDEISGRKSFKVGIRGNDQSIEWTFSNERSELSAAVSSIRVDGKTLRQPKKLQYLFPVSKDNKPSALTKTVRGLTYITAERVGPRESYPLEDPQTVQNVGPTGEHAVCLLHQRRDDPVLRGLVLKGSIPKLMHQVVERMRTFFPGCGLEITQVPNTNAVTLGMRTSDAESTHRPIHVGFGLTQIFPIIISALSAKKGDLLMIENPEVHLHPAGQAKMGQFLSAVAKAGVQVIIETHSDHVLNGIRRSVKAGGIEPENVSIHFFGPRSGESPQVVSPLLDLNGNIDHWPEGFFDQFDKDMNYFVGWGE